MLNKIRKFINKHYIFSWWVSHMVFSSYINLTFGNWTVMWIMLGVFVIGIILIEIDRMSWDVGNWTKDLTDEDLIKKLKS
jgi:hypothetical protein